LHPDAAVLPQLPALKPPPANLPGLCLPGKPHRALGLSADQYSTGAPARWMSGRRPSGGCCAAWRACGGGRGWSRNLWP